MVDGLQGGQIDMGGVTHTGGSNDPKTSMNAFLDFMSLVDATVIVRTGSSFSGMVTMMKGMFCAPVLDTGLTHRGLNICVPGGLAC